MRAYKFNFCGDDRIIVHPLGLPPSWKESNLTRQDEQAAIESANRQMRAGVLHLDPNTLEIVEVFQLDGKKQNTKETSSAVVRISKRIP